MTRAPYGMEVIDDCATCPRRKDGFFCQMSAATLADFQKMKFNSTYPGGAVLFVESQVPRGVYMLCEGRVKLTMASPNGKTVIVRVVEAGELLGLHAAVSGDPHEVTAETLQPCQIDFIRREDFMKLLHEHGDASISAMQQFTKYYRGSLPPDSLSGADSFGHRKNGLVPAGSGCARAGNGERHPFQLDFDPRRDRPGGRSDTRNRHPGADRIADQDVDLHQGSERAYQKQGGPRSHGAGLTRGRHRRNGCAAGAGLIASAKIPAHCSNSFWLARHRHFASADSAQDFASQPGLSP